MEFTKYSSIPNLSRGKTIPLDGQYVATEKVHGSNFSFYIYPNDVIKCAKRSAFLNADSSFFNHMSVFENNRIKLIELSRIARTICGKLFVKSVSPEDLTELDTQFVVPNTIIVYGEIFGGKYGNLPSNMKPVQKEVQYSPDVKFYAFDIKINGNFISYKTFQEICEEVGLFYSKPIAIGTFDEITSLDPEFLTTIPEQLGLQPIQDNTAEGYVIKPFTTVYNNKGGRIIFKCKSKKFVESRSIPIAKQPVPAYCQEIYGYISALICRNRLVNIMSGGPDIPDLSDKSTKATEIRLRMLSGMLIRDATREYETENHDLTKSVRKILYKFLIKDAWKITANYLETL